MCLLSLAGQQPSKLETIWIGLLNLQPIGVHDDFLELGGDSLLAMQMCFRIYETLHVEISQTALRETSTIATLAIAIDAIKKASTLHQ